MLHYGDLHLVALFRLLLLLSSKVKKKLPCLCTHESRGTTPEYCI